MHFIKDYFINFWIWWYLVKGKDMLRTTWRFWLYSFVYLRIGPMFGNLFKPMYQDGSWTGRIVAFPIRLIWGSIGLLLQICLSVIELAVASLYFLLPIFPIIGIGLYLWNTQFS